MKDEDRKIYVNPTIITLEQPFIFEGENCLSYPGLEGTNTQRYRRIVLEYYDREFVKQQEVQEGTFKSVVLQHEIDHLDGILYFDRVRKPEKREAKVERNNPCICGSGKKYKKCCLNNVKVA